MTFWGKKMITLIQFPKAPDRPSFSPFCLKLETYLKCAKVPYENKLTVSMGQSKKKKMPMILDGGELVEDSTFIIEHLRKRHGVDLDRHLTEEQKAIARAFQWLCEKSIVDIVVYFRWADKDNWPKFRELIFARAPWFVKVTIGNGMAKSIGKTLYKHGMGRFTDDEKLRILDENLSAISVYLGDKKYFFGDQVSTIDTILYAVLVQVASRGVVPQFEGVVERYPNLKRYVENFTKTHWPELAGVGS
jgi:glutathione S-transferase